MASLQAQKRLTREYKNIQQNPPPYVIARPNEDNILEWHYVITGPPNTVYEDGQYHGTLVFQKDYPFKPPTIRMTTPSGRFRTNTRLCLSMSDYHPDTWNPAWSVSTILTGLLSFMTSEESTTGAIQTTPQVRKKLARESKEWNLQSDRMFVRVFPELLAANRRDMAALKTRELAAKKVQETPIIDLDKITDPEDRLRAAEILEGRVAATGSKLNVYLGLVIVAVLAVGFKLLTR